MSENIHLVQHNRVRIWTQVFLVTKSEFSRTSHGWHFGIKWTYIQKVLPLMRWVTMGKLTYMNLSFLSGKWDSHTYFSGFLWESINEKFVGSLRLAVTQKYLFFASWCLGRRQACEGRWKKKEKLSQYIMINWGNNYNVVGSENCEAQNTRTWSTLSELLASSSLLYTMEHSLLSSPS